MSCPIDRLVDAGHATESELDIFRSASLDYARKWSNGGKLDYYKFLESVLSDEDFGHRFFGHTLKMWDDLVKANNSLPADSLKRVDLDLSFAEIPGYHYLDRIVLDENGNYDYESADFSSFIADSINGLGSSGVLDSFRGGNTKTWAQNTKVAERLIKEHNGLLNDRALAELGVKQDDAVRYYQLQLSASLREQNAISKQIEDLEDAEDTDSNAAQLNALKVRQLMSAEWNRLVTGVLSGKATEIGRALNNFKQMRRALDVGSDRMHEFIDTFGQVNPGSRTDPIMDTPEGAKEVATQIEEGTRIAKAVIEGKKDRPKPVDVAQEKGIAVKEEDKPSPPIEPAPIEEISTPPESLSVVNAEPVTPPSETVSTPSETSAALPSPATSAAFPSPATTPVVIPTPPTTVPNLSSFFRIEKALDERDISSGKPTTRPAPQETGEVRPSPQDAASTPAPPTGQRNVDRLARLAASDERRAPIAGDKATRPEATSRPEASTTKPSPSDLMKGESFAKRYKLNIATATEKERVRFYQTVANAQEVISKKADLIAKLNARTFYAIGDPVETLTTFFGDGEVAKAMVEVGKAAYQYGARTVGEFAYILKAEMGIENRSIAQAVWDALSYERTLSLRGKESAVSEPMGPAKPVPPRRFPVGPGEDPGPVKVLTKPTVNKVPNVAQLALNFDDFGYVAVNHPRSDRIQLYIAEHADGIRRRLWRDYKRPGEKGRMPETIDMLSELGGYYLTQARPKPISFAEWTAHMQSGIGQFIDHNDLVESYQRIKQKAWSKASMYAQTSAGVPIKKIAGYRRQALQRVIELADPTNQLEALADLREVDINDPEAILKYARILEKYKSVQEPNVFEWMNDVLRAQQLGPDASFSWNQGAMAILMDSYVNPINWIGLLDRPGIREKLPERLRGYATDAREREAGIRSAIIKSMASSYAISNKMARFLDKTIPKDKAPEELYQTYSRYIMDSPFYRQSLWDRFQLDLTTLGETAEQEEIYRGSPFDAWRTSKYASARWLNKIFKSSERAASMHGNMMRHEYAKRIGDMFIADGITPDTHPQLWQEMVSHANVLSGRAPHPEWMNKQSGAIKSQYLKRALSFIMLSNRYTGTQWRSSLIDPTRAIASLTGQYIDRAVISKIEKKVGGPIAPMEKAGRLLKGTHLTDMPPEVSVLVLKETARMYVGWGALVGIGMAVGAIDEVETEPWAANFMKFRFKNDPTWHDITGGRAQPITLFAASATGQYKDSKGRYYFADEKGREHFSRTDMLTRYGLGRLSPGGNLVKEVVTKEDFRRRPVWTTGPDGTPDMDIAWRSITSQINIQMSDAAEVLSSDTMTDDEKFRIAVSNYLKSLIGIRLFVPD